MTERGSDRVTRDATRLVIGPSALEWLDGGLRLHLDEITTPLPSRIRGTIEVRTGPRPAHRVNLDAQGRHRWGVIAPCARVDVRLDAPRLTWSGPAYLDSNRGCVPLEDDFVRWDWSRAHRADGRTAVVYDVERRDGKPLSIAHWFDDAGRTGSFDAPPAAPLPRTRWGLEQTTRSDAGSGIDRTPRIAMAMEDGPFYARSVVRTRWGGEPVTSVHEHLSLQRFERRWVRALLPFRMPRRIV